MGLKHALQSLWDPTADLLDREAQGRSASESADVFLRRLQLQLNRRLGSPYPGEYKGAFKGHGLDLHHLREYQAGDDIRKIDWNVLARTGVLHVKEHYEEKQIPVWFFVDATASMHFGQTQTKLAYAQELMGFLGLLALGNGHRVGMVLWQGEGRPEFIQPKPNMVHLQWMIQHLDDCRELDQFTARGETFPDLPAMMNSRALVFFLSDFGFLEWMPEALPSLARLSPKHQVETLMLVDPVEAELSYHHGWLPFQDANSRHVTWVNTSDRWLIKEYRRKMQGRLQVRQAQLARWSTCHPVLTREAPLDVVIRLVKAGRG